MAITPFLLEPKFNINPLLQQTFSLSPLRSPNIKFTYGYNNALKLKYSCYNKVIRYSPKLSTKCFSMSPKPKAEYGFGGDGGGEDNHLKAVAISSRTNVEVLWRSINNVLIKTLQIPVITGVILGLFLLYDHHHALAASGGRMGGSTFSSQSSGTQKSSPSSSSSSASPSYSSSSSSSSSSSRSYSSSSSSSRSPSYSSSPLYSSSSSWSSSSSSPSWSYSSSTPSRSSSTKSSKSYSTQTKDPVSSEEDGFSVGVDQPVVAAKPSDGDGTILWALFCICGLMVIMVAVIELDVFELGDRKRYTNTQNTVTAAQNRVTVAQNTVTAAKKTVTAVEKTCVLKLQVGLLGTARSLQGDLNRIAEVADTSTPQGLSYILQETILALLRHPDYCISGYFSVDAKTDIVEVEELFNRLSIEERGKFDEETLVNVNNIRKQSASTQKSNDFHNEYIVITIIVAAGGVYELPLINSSAILKETLQKLAVIPSSRIMAVEVLWTPQNENDTLTEREYLEDYPLLHPL